MRDSRAKMGSHPAKVDSLESAAKQLGHPSLRLTSLWTAARRIYPGSGVGQTKNRLQFTAAALKTRRALKNFLDRPENARLSREIAHRPELLGFVRWPFIHSQWPTLKRFNAMSQHLQALSSDMAALDISRSEAVIVADLASVSPGLRLVVDRAPWCLREGSLVFNQFVNEHRTMSLAFSFGRLNHERVAYVGSLQGSGAESALETYREVARDLLGMRARDFTIKSFQLLMHHLGVQRILCIAEDFRHHRHPYFTKDKAAKFHLNYNVVWQEHSGEPDGTGFYRLGTLPIVRPMEEIARKNRSLYRKRYAMLDNLSSEIASRFGPEAEMEPERITAEYAGTAPAATVDAEKEA